MTVDEHDISDDSLQGLLKALNLDTLKSYRTDFDQLDFQTLSQVKQEVESQLSVLFDVLRNKYRADMDTPLVTHDGFPRNDVDVVSIRLIRVKVIRLRNDNKTIIGLLEDKMIQEFASRQQNEPESSSQSEQFVVPFALVKDVANQGPAYIAGLRDDDKVIVFDEDIHAANHNKLANVVTRVRNSINRGIPVEVFRGEERLQLILQPTMNWGGQGVLGCRFIPL
ncbi:putative 26S proteasome regulatory subunit [Scheffersomyces stipitis CBS 6054]|uniref:Probable 26S proteasome regulatory subunit p27 n=1 Tax=Scheffersomyces stipitis (strain ATCC 58785 / CBS 6054 / NBRC 10063 / NRRL Y-11545) TaxID=322104 RepID=A3GFM7_PICST|nr:probable 26S proteasome regulatory subunit [Scheffersomyces stipitis CBS 6054]EAZ63781.1 putative 26S proteasome regulatory subunit [Scheffersomyces stipitis CBS 6054]